MAGTKCIIACVSLVFMFASWHTTQVRAGGISSGLVHFPNICKILNICHGGYRVYSRCLPKLIILENPNDITATSQNFTLVATLELNTTGTDTLMRHYDYTYNDDTREAIARTGETRFNVTLQSHPSNSSTPLESAKAVVHKGRCEDEFTTDSPKLTHFNSTNNSTELVEFALNSPGGDAVGDVGSLQGSYSFEGLINYDIAQSLVVYVLNKTICCDLVPSLPQLPQEFSVTLEANFMKQGQGESYTMHRKEYYSPWRNAERIEEHSHLTSKVEIMDIENDMHYEIFVDETYPKGICTERSLSSRETEFNTDEIGQLQSTASFLGFGHTMGREQNVSTIEEDYHGSEHYVRGIKCEKWSYAYEMPAMHGGPSGSYTVSHYFPDTDWRVRQESYHRLPKRILLNGTRGESNVLHYYDFIDMVPYIHDKEKIFDKCMVLESEFEGNCTCAKERLCVDVSTADKHELPSFIPTDGDSDLTLDQLCGEYGQLHGVPEPVVAGVIILMFALGIGAGIGGIYLYKHYRNKRAQAHQSFNDLAADAPCDGSGL